MLKALATEITAALAASGKERALKILSKSLYRDLRQSGYEADDIVALASELVSLVTADMKQNAQPVKRSTRFR
jgi:hypothetical protein